MTVMPSCTLGYLHSPQRPIQSHIPLDKEDCGEGRESEERRDASLNSLSSVALVLHSYNTIELHHFDVYYVPVATFIAFL